MQPGLSCGGCARCLAGEDNYCPRYDVLGYQSDGGYAELVAVPAANLIPLPDHIDVVNAAAFPLAFLTAWHMLVTRARLTEGDTVLVLAAGSGVGQAAVQIADAARRARHRHGRRRRQARACERLGAARVIDHYRTTSWRACASSRPTAAWTSSSNTSERRRGIAASGVWRAAGAW